MRAVRLRPIAKRPTDPGSARLTCGITLIRRSSRTRSRDNWALIGLETHGGHKGGDRTLVVFEFRRPHRAIGGAQFGREVMEHQRPAAQRAIDACARSVHVATGAVALVVISRISHARRCSALHREPRISRAYSAVSAASEKT